MRAYGCAPLRMTRTAAPLSARQGNARTAERGKPLRPNRPVGGSRGPTRQFLLPTQPIHRTIHRVALPDPASIRQRPKALRVQPRRNRTGRSCAVRMGMRRTSRVSAGRRRMEAAAYRVKGSFPDPKWTPNPPFPGGWRSIRAGIRTRRSIRSSLSRMKAIVEMIMHRKRYVVVFPQRRKHQ